MYSRIFFNAILVIGLFVAQYSLVGGLPAWFGNMNLPIIVLLFMIGMGKVTVSFWWMVGFGLLMESYSFMPFATIFISLAVVFTLAYLLMMNYFTDRTLYTFLAITLVATAAYDSTVFILNYLAGFLSRSGTLPVMGAVYWMERLNGLAINLLMVFIGYYLLNYLSKNLKPVFLIRKK